MKLRARRAQGGEAQAVAAPACEAGEGGVRAPLPSPGEDRARGAAQLVHLEKGFSQVGHGAGLHRLDNRSGLRRLRHRDDAGVGLTSPS